MEFPFGRKSNQSSWKSDENKSSFRTSLSEGSTRLFGSVMATKNGLFDGISNKFEQVVSIVGGGDDDDDDEEESTRVQSTSARPVKSQQGPKVRPGDVSPRTRSQVSSPNANNVPPPPAPNSMKSTHKPVISSGPRSGPVTEVPSSPGARQPPPGRPPAPRRTPRSSVSSEDALETRGQTHQYEGMKRQNSAPVGYEPSMNVDRSALFSSPAPTKAVSDNMAINFDAPLYGETASNASSAGVSPPEVFGAAGNTVPSTTGVPETVNQQQPETKSPRVMTKRPPMKRRNTNPFLNDDGSLIDDEQYRQPVVTAAEVYPTKFGSAPAPNDSSTPETFPAIYSTPQDASVVYDSMGTDLLPGIPRIPSEGNQSFLSTGDTGRDLLAITPTSRESLPPPQMEPEQSFQHSNVDDVYDDSDGDSEATEGCDDVPDSAYDPERDFDEPMFRSGSVGSDQSWTSSMSADSQMDEMGHSVMEFMKVFVDSNFDICASLSPLEKARFGELCQGGSGRLWFARYINAQRVNNKKVDEQIFYRLVQHFAVALFECNEAEDFVPAKILMNMCFTFFFEAVQPSGSTFKHFLYSYLKDQAIWQSLRFWNAAFFDAVQHERARKPLPSRSDDRTGKDEREYQENVTFGQLGTFTCNMCAFGLGKDLCLEFLRKQSTLANLRDEQIQMLRDNIERWSDQH